MGAPDDGPVGGSAQAQTAAWWLEEVRREERRGELLTAFDLAERGLAEHPDDIGLKHRAVLVLARAGATEEAARHFEVYGLGGFANDDEDVAALRARIAKDVALGSDGPARTREAARAAELYRDDLRADRRLLPAHQCGDVVARGRGRRAGPGVGRASARGRPSRAG